MNRNHFNETANSFYHDCQKRTENSDWLTNQIQVEEERLVLNSL